MNNNNPQRLTFDWQVSTSIPQFGRLFSNSLSLVFLAFLPPFVLDNGVARGSVWGVQTPTPLKNVKKISEDKIVEKIQRWSLHVLYRHQTTSFAQTKFTYLLKLTNYFKAVVLASDNANTTPRNHTRIRMTVRVQQMDIPERGCHESRRESRMGGEAFCSEINHDHR